MLDNAQVEAHNVQAIKLTKHNAVQNSVTLRELLLELKDAKQLASESIGIFAG
jgi:hypothetical protein